MSKNVTWIREDALSVRRLTTEEKKWIGRLARVLADCPDRLEPYGRGRDRVDVIDKYAADNDPSREGIVLASITACRASG